MKNLKNLSRRGLALLLTLVMCLGMLQLTVFADNEKCGKEEHTHTDSCYTNNLICTRSEQEEHEHTDACTEVTDVLTCKLEEKEAHEHTDECYDLTCGQEEVSQEDVHEHTDECYEDETLTCDKEEVSAEDVHEHTDDCYELTCGKEEVSQEDAHEHTDDCYEEQETFTCGKQEITADQAHKHDATCYDVTLTCGKEEHTHTAACNAEDLVDVYVYIKLTGAVSSDGWMKNSQGYYTVGKISVRGLPDANDNKGLKYLLNQHDQVDWAIAALDTLEPCTKYGSIPEFDFADVTWKCDNKSLTSCQGATDYDETSGRYYWHLDGYLDVSQTYTVTVNYAYAEDGCVVDGDPNLLPPTYTKENVRTGDVVKVNSPTVNGYIADKTQVTVNMGNQDVEVTVYYHKDADGNGTWDCQEGNYTVAYRDGANGDVFETQSYSAKKGETTPEFSTEGITLDNAGNPYREDFTFNGWNPEVAETVTGNVIYTAQWKSNEPVVTKYTVTYTDGVDGKAFKDQVTEVEEGAKTPEFNGTPTRDGYTFIGWDTEVAETVTDNVTYTATWKEALKPTFYGTDPYLVQVTLNNEFNKGNSVTEKDLPEDFQVEVTATYCDKSGEVHTETKILKLKDATNIKNSYATGSLSVMIQWENVFDLPVWRYSQAGLTPDSFESKYTTTVVGKESNFNVGNYTCTSNVNAGKIVSKSDDGADPYQVTTVYKPSSSSVTLAGMVIRNSYRAFTPDITKVGVMLTCEDSKTHGSVRNQFYYGFSESRIKSGAVTMTQKTDDQWVVSVDSEKWLEIINAYLRKMGVTYDHKLVTTEPESITFIYENGQWTSDKEFIDIKIEGPKNVYQWYAGDTKLDEVAISMCDSAAEVPTAASRNDLVKEAPQNMTFNGEWNTDTKNNDDGVTTTTVYTAKFTSNPQYYTVTVNYVSDKGETVAPSQTSAAINQGSEYDVTEWANRTFEGWKYVRTDGAVRDTSNSDVTVNVVYTRDANNDNIADKYQVVVTFHVVNGDWNDDAEGAKVVYLTKLDANGEPAEDGTATLTADQFPAVGDKPASGYRASGSWSPARAEVQLTDDAEYTFTYARRSSGGGGGGGSSRPSTPSNPGSTEPPVVDIPDEEPPLVDVPDVDTPVEPPVVDIPDEEPPLVDIPDEEPPLVDIPDEEPPLVDIPDEEPPLVDVPDVDNVEPPVVEIPENTVPLSDVPKTGDSSGIWTVLALLSAAGLLGLTVYGRKKHEEI